jgi:F-type H+-transporting ATPase subunit delta
MAARFTRPYVDALFEVAGSAEAVEALLPGLEGFAATLRDSAELRAVLSNPGVERDRKNALVSAVASRVGMNGLGTRLLTTLLHNGRLLRVAEVAGAARERLDKDRRIVEARVTSAAPLAGGDTARIKGALEAKTSRSVRLVEDVDPALLGGFVVKMGSEVYDASLKQRLERARRALHGAEPAQEKAR